MPQPVPYHRPSSSRTDTAPPLPNNLEAERAVLGAIVLDNGALRAAREHLQPADFYLPQHRVIFGFMMELHEAKKPIDTIALMDALESRGQLEAAGGIAYLSQLGDGLPRVTNVSHYARIVLEKSRLRTLIYSTEMFQQQSIASQDSNSILQQMGELRTKMLAGSAAKLVAVDVDEFLDMALPPLEYVIEPLLSARGRGMVYAQRGAGKTYVCLELGYSVAMGAMAFVWPVGKPRPVKYVEGEMDGAQLQERLRHLCARVHEGRVPVGRQMRLIAKDLPGQNARPRINTNEGRAQITDLLDAGDLLFLDNLTALSPSSDEKESEDWAQIQEWLIDLSCEGVSTIVVHHAGWNAEHSRGSSKREDLLDFVLSLKIPGDYGEEGLRAEVAIRKKRGRPASSSQAAPFEVKLEEDCWTMRPLLNLQRENARKMLEAGMHPREVAQDTGLSRYVIYRLQKEVKNNMVSVDPERPDDPPTPF